MPRPNVSPRFLVSPGLMPEAATRMRTSPGPGVGSGISPTFRTSRARPCFSYQAALIQDLAGQLNICRGCSAGLKSLQVDDDVCGRLRATNEEVAVGRLIERLRIVGHRARNQAALAVVANSAAARPTNGDVAGFGQLQKAAVGRCVPVGGDAAARKRHQRTGAAVIFGKMRRPRRCGYDTRHLRFAAVENFDM